MSDSPAPDVSELRRRSLAALERAHALAREAQERGERLEDARARSRYLRSLTRRIIRLLRERFGPPPSAAP